MLRKQMAHAIVALVVSIACAAASQASDPSLPYCVVDTGQKAIFADRGQLFTVPASNEPFYGQDAFYQGPQPTYRDNKDGTVTDLNTGLMWQKTPGPKVTHRQALEAVRSFRLTGHPDWRLPSVKELYSLINYNGNCRANPPIPFIDTRYFDFRFGDETQGERIIDAQYVSSTECMSSGGAKVFGVNFADGRIKAYPTGPMPGRSEKKFVLIHVRGNPRYGQNDFQDNRNGTITDRATGLMWTQSDSGRPMNWQSALAWVQTKNQENHLGFSDWRLPNAKELQSLVDYTRAPDARSPAQCGPAINPLFKMTDPEGWFWSSTTFHEPGPRGQGGAAIYVAFGRAMGNLPRPDGTRSFLNVHGAGAQRTDPKDGDPKSPVYVNGFGPQGDEIRIFNYARAVRNVDPRSIQRVVPDLAPIPAASIPGGPPPERGRSRRLSLPDTPRR